MRDFFIRAFEAILSIVVVLSAIGVLVLAWFAAFAPGGPNGEPAGVAIGLLVLIAGAVYLVLIAGAMYLGLGIYQNTRRAAGLLEQIAAK